MAEGDLGIPGLSDYEKVGEGGFAVVYSAVEVDARRRVAVKVLAAKDPRSLRRFERERRLMGQTTAHDSIVTLFRSGYTDLGNPYLIMEFMPGGSLQDRLEMHGPVPVDEAVDIILPVARGLEFAHHSGIVHKDIKPANILISATGAPKLSDFGISTVRDATGPSQIAFSLAYTAPETFNATRTPTGEVIDPRDERSDLYSLTATLFAIVAGNPPFTASSQAALMHQILTEPPPRIGDHPALNRLLATGLAKDPRDRYSSASQFIDVLDSMRRSSLTSPEAVTLPSPRTDRRVTNRPTRIDRPRAVPGHPGSDWTGLPAKVRPKRRRWRSRSMSLLAGVAIVTAALLLLTTTFNPARRSDVDKRASAVLTRRSGAVTAVIELADGRIASAGDDGKVQISDPAHPGRFASSHIYSDKLLALAQLRNGTVASASRDGTVEIWNPAQPDITLATYAQHRGPVSSVTQLDDGNIASASWDDTVQIWSPNDPKHTIATYLGHSGSVWFVTKLDNGNVASTSIDRTIRIWNPTDPTTTIAKYSGHVLEVTSMVELNNSTIASASVDGTVRIWDPANVDSTIAVYAGHSGAVLSIIQLANGNVASAASDGVINIWDPARPDITLATYSGHTDAVTSIVQLSDGSIASASRDGTVQIWKPDSG